jgi:hypothetical protein
VQPQLSEDARFLRNTQFSSSKSENCEQHSPNLELSEARAKSPSFTVIGSQQGTVGPPNAILTTYELWQLYKPLMDDPDVYVLQLDKGPFTVVSTSFYSHLSERKWYGQYSRDMGLYYARTTYTAAGEYYMHREIMRLAGKLAMMVDHVNGDTLDNRLSNLEPTSNAGNQAKADRRALQNPSGYEGVRIKNTAFEAYFNCGGKRYYVGTFRTAVEAAKARDEMMALICPETRKLSVQDAERLERLRYVNKQMREGRLKYAWHNVRPFGIRQTAA